MPTRTQTLILWAILAAPLPSFGLAAGDPAPDGKGEAMSFLRFPR